MWRKGEPIGVLGLGSIGLRHARNLIKLGQQVIGFDPNLERRHLLEQAGGGTTTERKDVLGCAALVIASPPGQHLQDLAEAVALGHSCLIEKPIAHTDQGLQQILDHADSAGLIVYVGFMLRFHACVTQAKQALESGEIGRPLWARFLASAYLPSWRPYQDYRNGYAADPATGGVLFDDIHEIDLATYLLGRASLSGAAVSNSQTLGLASEDVAQLILSHQGGHISTIHLDYCSRPARREVEIMGTLGSLRLDLIARRLQMIDLDGRIVTDATLPGSFDQDYEEEMRSYLACLEGKALPPCDGRGAAEVLDIVLRARRLCSLPVL
ncbi:MAG: Gfo/Idh/MocA family oxidoreductase [Alphaproteobacteria bacterium]|nr:Gfo/Idh/MocA family oxidoreductase [Alphaproteobacteria bacterium]